MTRKNIWCNVPQAFFMAAMLLIPKSLPTKAQTPVDSSHRQSVPMQAVIPQRPERPLQAGTVLVQGVITDAQGNPLPSATVYVRETKGGAVADSEGRFSISVPQNQRSTIDYSFLGMKTLTKSYDGRRMYTNQTIVLQEDNQLSEVVVTGLFDYKSSTFTGSTSSFTRDELKQVSGSNILKAVQALDPA